MHEYLSNSLCSLICEWDRLRTLKHCLNHASPFCLIDTFSCASILGMMHMHMPNTIVSRKYAPPPFQKKTRPAVKILRLSVFKPLSCSTVKVSIVNTDRPHQR